MANKYFALSLLLFSCIASACTLQKGTAQPSAIPTAVTQTASPEPTVTASPSATPAPTKKAVTTTTAPLINCLGPDGKTIKLTQKACTDFQTAWKVTTPSPSSATTQVTGCASYNPTGPLGTARVSVKIESGQSWVGQAGFDFTEKYQDCKGNGLDYGARDIISGETTRDFSGLRPGPYKVEVLYHGKTWSTDVNLNGGTSEVTVTVSNN